jgi:NAD(P) transhydrogenase subunit alpha
MANLLLMAGVFIVSFIVGYLLISRVPSLLHTPLMSMTNAISAVTILGALILFSVPTSLVEKVLGALAIITATFNVVGGFAITDRMLRLFKEKRPRANNP